MIESKPTIFISYRRSVGAFIARAVFENLRNSGFDVFMDIESMDSGKFDDMLMGQIASRDNFVLILTPGTLERCVEDEDWVRREIEHAIKTERNIVPLLMDSFRFETHDEILTGILSELPRYNSIRVPIDFFEEAMARLEKRFLVATVKRKSKITKSEQKFIDEQIAILDNEPTPTKDELSAEHYFGLGFSLQENGLLEQAIAEYNLAIKLKPDYRRAFYNRGLAYQQLGILDQAQTDYETTIEIEPSYAKGHHNLGLIHYANRNLELALDCINHAIELNDTLTLAYANRAKIHKDLGKLDNAEADLLHYEQVTGEKIILDARSELTQLDQTLPVEDEEHNKHHYLEAMATTRPLADRPANDELFKPHKAFGQFRDQGMVRSNNQDAVYSFLSIQDSLSDILNFGLFIVADGMGGHSEGEKASDMTISVIAQEILNRAYLPLLHGVDMNDVFSALSDIIIGAIQTANSRVRSDVADASSTATVAVLFNNYLYLGHVGDTRAYLIKDDSIEQISRDHSLVMRLMELGQITPEEAETHVQRNVLYRVIGQNENVEVDILTRLVPNARLLLCSDGLWDMLDDETIADVVRSEPHPQIACNKLVKMANNNGGKDNISVILIQTF